MDDVLLRPEGEYSIPYFENKATIYQNGPVGFWFIKLERGVTPKELKGAYTDPGTAVKAVEGLLAAKKFLKN